MGVIDTDMTKVVHKKYSDLIEQGVFPIARWGTPDDIGGAVSAFCTDKFIYSTGNYIDLDGGLERSAHSARINSFTAPATILIWTGAFILKNCK